MSVEDILNSIQESHEAAKNHLLAQAEYEAGQILAQKKAQLEEWKKKQETEWKEKLEREYKTQRSRIDILLSQEKKRAFYESSVALFERTLSNILVTFRQEDTRYKKFLLGCIRKAAMVWNTREMRIILSERDSHFCGELGRESGFVLHLEKGRILSGGIICRYEQEELDFSFEQIRETLQREMIQWIYQQTYGEKE